MEQERGRQRWEGSSGVEEEEMELQSGAMEPGRG